MIFIKIKRRNLRMKDIKSLVPFTFPSIENYLENSPFSSFFNFEDTYPKVDMKENESEITLKCELPGMNKDNINVEMKDSHLILSGERKTEEVTGDERIHRTEISYGKFLRSFYIPADIDAERIEATFKDGILIIVLPKTESERAKKIEVK
jgi:HSP20 family protein